jgi:hypothetical protein
LSRPIVLHGDEAYFPEEWEAKLREREKNRIYHHGYYQRNRERINAYNREWTRRKRALDRESWPLVTGWLHSLACTEYHRERRKDCKPMAVVTHVP